MVKNRFLLAACGTSLLVNDGSGIRRSNKVCCSDLLLIIGWRCNAWSHFEFFISVVKASGSLKIAILLGFNNLLRCIILEGAFRLHCVLREGVNVFDVQANEIR